VQPEVGFILSEGESEYGGSMAVTSGVSLCTSVDMLRDIAAGIGPEHFLFCLGYAGWGPDQLETEIARNDWLVVPSDPELIFRLPPAERWGRAIRSLGIDPGFLSETMGNA
jgi:putative transcriptional regulator